MTANANRTTAGDWTALTSKQSVDIEHHLVNAICSSPAMRKQFLSLAEFLEASGRLEESATVYSGQLPLSIKERFKLDPYPRARSRDLRSCIRLVQFSEEFYHLAPPLNDDETRNSVFLQQHIRTCSEYVDLMEHCTLIYDGKSQLYLDNEGVRNSDYSTINSYLLTVRQKNTQQCSFLKGVSLLLATHNSHNFYHWHFDVLPALSLIRAAGISLSDIDHILVDSRNKGFQTQMLKIAGISDEQIRFINVDNCHLQCEKLILWRTYNSQGMAQSHRHLDWLRSTFMAHANILSTSSQQYPSRLAIKRTKRGFSNADKTYEQLNSKGYYCVNLENLHYIEQLKLFVNANTIVAPHGAGLSLIAYCKPDTVIHEFYSDHVQPCFWSLANALSLRYNNYSCYKLTGKELNNGNKNLKQRLTKTIELTPSQIENVL